MLTVAVDFLIGTLLAVMCWQHVLCISCVAVASGKATMRAAVLLMLQLHGSWSIATSLM
jgi:hypothetical protein